MGGNEKEDGTDRDLNAPEPLSPGVSVSAGEHASPDAAGAMHDALQLERDALGPEGDATIEIDIVRGRVSMDLETLGHDLDAAGPEHDEVDLVAAELAVPLGPDMDELLDEVGPEFDLEHLQDQHT